MKMLRFLLSAVMLVALLAGMQITALAALVSPADDEVSRIADTSRIANEHETSLPGTPRANTDNSLANEDVSRLHDIAPISVNPDTGAESLAIPAAVALLAASTAAIALSSKKKK